MATKTVTVLTINGRRQNVKVEANTTILEVLEQVCQKHNLKPEEYELKHHNKVIDLTTMYRFSGLPNNALLEMAEAKQKRQESDVVLVVQLETGERHQGTYKCSTFLLDVVKELCPDKADDPNSVIIYMRREVFGEALGTTSLKSLGLTGGRAIFRLVQRDPESLKVQANVSAPLPVKEKPEDTKPQIEKKIKVNESRGEEEASTSKSFKPSPEIENEMKKAKVVEEMDIDVPDEILPEPIIEKIGEREAVAFKMESAGNSNLADLPDSFFDITIKDVRRLYSDLRNQVKELDDAPLMTAEYRQLEESKRILNQLGRYKHTVIRIQFPDRVVLQGIFKPTETFAEVKEFVKPFLADETLNFHLYTTPPKEIVSSLESLVEAKCVPQALIHFGCDDKNVDFLKEEFYGKLSNATGAALIAAKSRGLKIDSVSTGRTEGDEAAASATTSESMVEEKSSNQKSPNNNFLQSSASASSSNDVKLPKWFKPLGK